MMIQLLFILAVAGVGVGVSGRFVIDEIFIALALLTWFITRIREAGLAGIASNLGGSLSRSIRPILPLYLLTTYLFAQSIRSFLQNPLPEFIPYIAHLAFLLISVTVLSNLFVSSHRVNRERIIHIIGLAAIGFNAVYIFQGVMLEFLHLHEKLELPARFLSQGHYWSGSAYSSFASMTGLMAAALHRNTNTKMLFWLTTSTLVVAFFYDSRISLALGVASLFYLFMIFNVSNTAKAVFAMCVLYFGIVICANFPSARKTVVDAALGIDFLFNPRVEESAKSGDYDRQAHFLAGFRAIKDNPVHMIFGHGYLSHRALVGENVRDILSEHPLYRKFLQENDAVERPASERGILGGSRTTSFTAILIDGGMLGVTLFIFCLVRFCADGVMYVRNISNSRVRQILLLDLYAGLAIFSLVIFLHDMTAYWFTMCLPALLAFSLSDRNLEDEELVPAQTNVFEKRVEPDLQVLPPGL